MDAYFSVTVIRPPLKKNHEGAEKTFEAKDMIRWPNIVGQRDICRLQ